MSGTLTAPNLNVKGSATHCKSQMNVARAVCYSALTGQGNASPSGAAAESHMTEMVSVTDASMAVARCGCRQAKRRLRRYAGEYWWHGTSLPEERNQTLPLQQ